MKTQSIYHRGTEILKIENLILIDHEDFQDDFIYVSRGFFHALELGLTPITGKSNEWHHYFVKDEEYGFDARKIYFSE